MPTLLEKIEANAAQRLPLPPGQQPNKELARYKNFLKVETHRLKILHRGGGGGQEVCHARATVIDLLIRHILDAVRRNMPDAKSASAPLAIVAIGGYGRGELNPFSDIDIMFLHSGELVSGGKPKPYMTALMDGLLYTLWDIGLKVGHSVRSVEDCVRIANTDMQSKTSLIESRLVAGDAALVERMQRVVLAKCVRGFEDDYIAARIADQEGRRTKFGNSAYMQEPNIKNGSGGLRDYQNLLWMIYFKYRARSLSELLAKELIGKTECRQLEGAYDFLLRVRNDLHYHAGRAGDVLTRGVQPAVAYNLGYTDRGPRKRLEKFMRAVYTHMRNIYLMSRSLEQRLALLPEKTRMSAIRGLIRKGRERATQHVLDGFKIVGDEIRAVAPRVFRDQPRRLMRVFLHVQQRNLKLHPDLAQMIRNHLALVDREFLKDRHVHETFLEILNQRGNVAPVLRLMHEAGFLGKYLPEFGKLTCLVQHEFYHQYTADEHTLLCVEKLDQIWNAKEPPFSHYSELFQEIEHPYLLYVALLLHDAGKGSDTDAHSDASARLALRAAKRLGIDGVATQSLRLVIEHHLLMAQISQRRDMDDSSVIRQFAAQIQNGDNLKLLTLLTFADSQGTSPDLWNGFKDSLLWTLHDKARAFLSGETEFLRAEEERREQLAGEVRKIMPRTFRDDELEAHFEHLPPRYFRVQSARQVLNDLTLAHRFMHRQTSEDETSLEPVVHWHNEPDRGYTAVTICTWDRPGLFSKIVGSLSAAGLNILSAQIHTRTDGIILDTFFVTDARSGGLANRAGKEEFEKFIGASLAGTVNLAALIARRKITGADSRLAGEERIPTVITFDNESSDYYTVLEAQTEDHVGLLYAISQTLADLRLDIAIAKIATEKGAAIDSFYISTEENSKVTSAEFQRHITVQLRAAITSLESTP
jgi:[protein-PII] uridylyltransferase